MRPGCEVTRLTAPSSSRAPDAEPRRAWQLGDRALVPATPELDNWMVHSQAALGCDLCRILLDAIFPVQKSLHSGSPYLSFYFLLIPHKSRGKMFKNSLPQRAVN